MHHPSRRQLIRLAAASAGAATLPAPASLAQSMPTLKATHFGGPYGILEKLVAQPLAERGIARVVYEVENSGTALAKMQAQRDNPPFNVALLTRGVAIRANNIGLIEPLSAAEVAEAGELAEGAAAPDRLGIGFLFESIDIMFDTKRVSTPIESWLDLWRPEFKGRLLMPALPLPAAHLIIMITAKALSGASEKDEKAIDAAFRKLKELKPNIRTFYRDPIQANQLLERGEAIACPAYGARIGNFMKTNPDIARTTTKEGVPATVFDIVILKGSANRDASRKYMNLCVSTPVQQQVANVILATPVNRSAKIEPENRKYIMHDYSRLGFFDEVYVAGKQREWFDRWTREIES